MFCKLNFMILNFIYFIYYINFIYKKINKITFFNQFQRKFNKILISVLI